MLSNLIQKEVFRPCQRRPADDDQAVKSDPVEAAALQNGVLTRLNGPSLLDWLPR